jgi:hypothetical protein
MAVNYNTVKCKSCARVLANITPTGLTPTTSSDSLGCDACQRFDSLYDAVQTADREWAPLENKRDTLTKHFAKEKHKKIHMEFDNWLIGVEALPTWEGKVMNQEFQTHNGSENPKSKNENQQQGSKRSRSHSPITKQSEDGNAQNELSGPLMNQQQGSLLSPRPSSTWSHSTTSLPGRKRLKFSDSVEFRDNYRISAQYHRPSETYTRGRHAPPEEGGYMDTSGSGQTFVKFTGMKKVGAKWVELTEEELAAKKSEGAKASAELRSLGVTGQPSTQQKNSDTAYQLNQNATVSPDARAARVARRAKGAQGSKTSRSENERPLRKAINEARGPSLDPSQKPTFSDGAVTLTAEGMGMIRNPVDALDSTAAETTHEERKADVDISGPDKDRRNDAVFEAFKNGPCGKDDRNTESGLRVRAESQAPQSIPATQTSCVAWEATYMASTFVDWDSPTTRAISEQKSESRLPVRSGTYDRPHAGHIGTGLGTISRHQTDTRE